MTRLILTALCVVAAAAAATAKPAKHEGKAADIMGRWQGPNYRMAALAPDCGEGKCNLTLDIVRCGEGWCGIEVGQKDACGGTALKLDAGEPANGSTIFKGRLELAHGTEPYVVQAYLVPASGGSSEGLEIEGDTGGEFRAFRRSFPFNAHLVRAGEAVCKSEKPVS
jgi:uncharacterized low-complexity protein